MNYVISPSKCFTHKMFSIQNKNNSPKVLVFKQKRDAVNFSKFLIENKCRHQQWPLIDIDTLNTGIQDDLKSDFKCHLPTFVSSFIQVTEWNSNRLTKYLAINGVQIMLAEQVVYDTKSLNIKMDIGERKYDVLDNFIIRKNLENKSNF